MARTKDELTQYVNDLCKEKGFTPEQTAIAVGVATGDEKYKDVAGVVGPLIDLAVGRHADYAKAMDAARADQKKATDHFASLNTWREKTVLPQLTALQTRLKKFEDKYGDIDEVQDIGGGKGVTVTGEVVDMKKVDELRAQDRQAMAKEFLAFESDKSALAREYWEKFKEPLDINPLLETIGKAQSDPANPRSMSLRDAFNAVHGEKVRAIEVKAREDELKAAEKRGADEATKRLRLAGAVSGAARPEGQGGAFWDQQNSAQKAGDDSKLSDADRAAAFGNDLITEMTKNEALETS